MSAAARSEPGRLLPAVAAAARGAGEAILEVYRTDFIVRHKTDASPVTEADLAAHHIIIDHLKRLTPELPVLSEESGSGPWGERARWRRYWLVDPLDGTREFINGTGEFTVNIALIEEHRPVLGVIYAPVAQRLYQAVAGGGAQREDSPGCGVAIRTRRPDFSDLVVATSRSHPSERVTDFLKRLGPHTTRPMGSSLKSCLVAEGSADLYVRLGPTAEWDTAAAQCIVEEAGGHLTDTGLQPLRYNTRDSLLNPEFFVFGSTEHDWRCYLDDSETRPGPRS